MHTCHVNASRPWLIPHAIGWFHLLYNYIPHSCMLALAKAILHWPLSLARCVHATPDACKPWMIFFCLGWPLHINVCTLNTMLEGNIQRTMCASNERCLQAMFEVRRRMCVGYVQWFKVMFDIDKPMCVGCGRCWKAMYQVGWQLCAGQRRWGKSMLDVARLLFAGHRWWRKSMSSYE